MSADIIKDYTELMERKVMETAGSAPEYKVDINKTLLLVVDEMNDGNREEGFLKKGLGFDISLAQKTEAVVVKLAERALKAGVTTCYVQSIYDFQYLPKPMREQFEMIKLPDWMDNKGLWGTQLVDTLPPPDLLLVKSHFSSFSPHTFAFKPGLHPEITEYLTLPAELDEKLRKQNKKTMYDYFLEAQANSAVATSANIDRLLELGVIGLDAFLKAKGIDTLIIVGESTNVCFDAAVCGAAERGYRLLLPVDGAASEQHDKHWCYLDNHGFFKGILLTADKIIF